MFLYYRINLKKFNFNFMFIRSNKIFNFNPNKITLLSSYLNWKKKYEVEYIMQQKGRIENLFKTWRKVDEGI